MIHDDTEVGLRPEKRPKTTLLNTILCHAKRTNNKAITLTGSSETALNCARVLNRALTSGANSSIQASNCKVACGFTIAFPTHP
jgi:hypothetical protein